MENFKGTVIASKIVPSSSGDTYATHDEAFGYGGYRTVETIIERDNIPVERRKVGMLVYVLFDENNKPLKTTYRLSSDLNTWEEVQESEIERLTVTEAWWTNATEEDKNSNAEYYVPVYNESGAVEFYVVTSNTAIQELTELVIDADNGFYRVKEDGDASHSPKLYSASTAEGYNLYDTQYAEIEYFKTYVYAGTQWIEGSTKLDNGYTLDDSLNVIYSKNYDKYLEALEVAGVSHGETGTTEDDMTTMKQALDVLYAYLFPADYVDWNLTVRPSSEETKTVYVYQGNTANIQKYVRSIDFTITNKQGQKAYSIQNFEVEGETIDTSNPTLTSFTSAVTLSLEDAIINANVNYTLVDNNFVVTGNCKLSSSALNGLQNVNPYSLTESGTTKVSGTVVTTKDNVVNSQSSSVTKDFVLVSVYQKPSDWNIISAKTATTPYLGHPYNISGSVTVSENKLSSSVTVNGQVVERVESDKNKNFASGVTLTLDGQQGNRGERTFTRGPKQIAPITKTVYTDISHGVKTKVVSKENAYPQTSMTYSCDTDVRDVYSQKPKEGNGTIVYNVSNNVKYTNVTDWSSSNVASDIVLENGSCGVKNGNNITAYEGQVVSAKCQSNVSANTKLDFDSNDIDIDYQDYENYCQNWMAAFTTDITVKMKKGTSLNDMTELEVDRNTFATKNSIAESASTVTAITHDVLTFSADTLNPTTYYSIEVSSNSGVTDVKEQCPRPYTLTGSVSFEKADMIVVPYPQNDKLEYQTIENGTSSRVTKTGYMMTYDNGYYILNENLGDNMYMLLSPNNISFSLWLTDDTSATPEKFSNTEAKSNIEIQNVIPNQQYVVNGYYAYLLGQKELDGSNKKMKILLS